MSVMNEVAREMNTFKELTGRTPRHVRMSRESYNKLKEELGLVGVQESPKQQSTIMGLNVWIHDMKRIVVSA